MPIAPEPNDAERQADAARNASGPANREPTRLIRSEDLFDGERVVLIQHAGEQYRLLITRNDRLILQK